MAVRESKMFLISRRKESMGREACFVKLVSRRRNSNVLAGKQFVNACEGDRKSGRNESSRELQQAYHHPGHQ